MTKKLESRLCQSTRRRFTTRAVTDTPWMSKVKVEPRPTSSCRAISSSTEISGSRAASSGVHHRPAVTALWRGGAPAPPAAGHRGRDQHRARLAAGPMEIRYALAPGQRTASREPRERDDEPGGEGEQQEGRGEPPDEQAADLPGASLPERERREPAHDDERSWPRPPAREPRLHRPSQDERRPHPADLEQRPQREQERDAHAHGEAAQHRPRGQDEVHRQRQETGEERSEDGLERASEGGAGETSAEPEQGGLDEIDREHVAPP